MSMIRTQIYIPEEEHKKLLRIAQDKKIPMAKIVRDFISDGLQKERQKDYSGKRTLKILSTLGLSGGPKDLSKNIDHYLYGAPKKLT